MNARLIVTQLRAYAINFLPILRILCLYSFCQAFRLLSVPINAEHRGVSSLNVGVGNNFMLTLLSSLNRPIPLYSFFFTVFYVAECYTFKIIYRQIPYNPDRGK